MTLRVVAWFALVACKPDPVDTSVDSEPVDTSAHTDTAVDSDPDTDPIDTDTGVDPDTGRPALTWFDASDGVPTAEFHDLTVAADGTLVAGTTAGLVTVRADDTVAVYTTADGLAADDVHGVLFDADDTLWLGYSGVALVDGQRATFDASGPAVFETIDINATMEIAELHRFARQPYGARAGDVWMGSNEGLCVYEPGTSPTPGVYREHNHPTHPHGDTLGVDLTSDGHAWNGDQYQLSRWSAFYALVEYAPLWPVTPSEVIAVRDLDADGMIVWVASDLYGVARVDAAAASLPDGTTFPAPAVASAWAIRSAGDVVYIGGPGGLWTLDAAGTLLAWTDVPAAVEAIAVDADHATVWLGTSAGIARIR